MKSNNIGGYFELELNSFEEYHCQAIRLNTARNAFEYILKAKGYQSVYLPFFTCDAMLEAVRKLNIQIHFYSIDEMFRPIFNFSIIEKNGVFVYTNYFGICDTQVLEVHQKCENLIIDNAQAFFSAPLPNVDTIYSPRKFFGVPDGAYLYTNQEMGAEFEQDVSLDRFEHLLGRIEKGAEEYYNSFKKNDEKLSLQPIRKMSKLTKYLLSGINYENASNVRRGNFTYLHEKLKSNNSLKFELGCNEVPLVFPYLANNGQELKKKLIDNNIFVPTYWPNVLVDTKHETVEYNFSKNIVSLPIDQRYSLVEMDRIINLIA
mgnify:CR=1 FL=1